MGTGLINKRLNTIGSNSISQIQINNQSLQLIERLNEINDGSFLIDDYEIRELKRL